MFKLNAIIWKIEEILNQLIQPLLFRRVCKPQNKDTKIQNKKKEKVVVHLCVCRAVRTS